MFGVFNTAEENLKQCVTMQGKTYVKKCRYIRGELVRRATDDPQSLAKTVLGVMIFYMFGGPMFISKMLPIGK